MDIFSEAGSPEVASSWKDLRKSSHVSQEIPLYQAEESQFRRSHEIKRPYESIQLRRNCISLSFSKSHSDYQNRLSESSSSTNDVPPFLEGEMNERIHKFNRLSGKTLRLLPSFEFKSDFSFRNFFGGDELNDSPGISNSEESDSNYSFDSERGAEDVEISPSTIPGSIDCFPQTPGFHSSGIIESIEERINHGSDLENDFQTSRGIVQFPLFISETRTPPSLDTEKMSKTSSSPGSTTSHAVSHQRQAKLKKKKQTQLIRKDSGFRDSIKSRKSFIQKIAPRMKKGKLSLHVEKKSQKEGRDSKEFESSDQSATFNNKLPKFLSEDPASVDQRSSENSRRKLTRRASSADLSTYISGPLHLRKSTHSSGIQKIKTQATFVNAPGETAKLTGFKPPYSSLVFSNIRGLDLSQNNNQIDKNGELSTSDGCRFFRTETENKISKVQQDKINDKILKKFAAKNEAKIEDKKGKKVTKNGRENSHNKNRGTEENFEVNLSKNNENNLSYRRTRLSHNTNSAVEKSTDQERKSTQVDNGAKPIKKIEIEREKEFFGHLKFWKNRSATNITKVVKDFENDKETSKEKKKNKFVSLKKNSKSLKISAPESKDNKKNYNETKRKIETKYISNPFVINKLGDGLIIKNSKPSTEGLSPTKTDANNGSDDYSFDANPNKRKNKIVSSNSKDVARENDKNNDQIKGVCDEKINNETYDNYLGSREEETSASTTSLSLGSNSTARKLSKNNTMSSSQNDEGYDSSSFEENLIKDLLSQKYLKESNPSTSSNSFLNNNNTSEILNHGESRSNIKPIRPLRLRPLKTI